MSAKGHQATAKGTGDVVPSELRQMQPPAPPEASVPEGRNAGYHEECLAVAEDVGKSVAYVSKTEKGRG